MHWNHGLNVPLCYQDGQVLRQIVTFVLAEFVEHGEINIDLLPF